MGENYTMAFGLKPSRRVGGATNNKAMNKYRTANSYATALFAGDPVTVSGGVIVKAANGDKVQGVVESFNYIAADGRSIFTTYLPASTSSSGFIEGDARPLVLVNDDPYATFLLQAKDSLVVAATDNGKLYTCSVAGAGDTYRKQSAVTMDTVTTSVDQSMVRLIGLYETPGNAYGVSAQIFEVALTNHALK